MTRRTDAGFTLIETLVALVVFVAVASVMYQTMGSNWRGLRRVQKDVAATALGKSKLAATGIDAPLADGQQFTGDDNGISWTITVARYLPPGEAPPAGSPRAYWLDFQARWRDGPAQRPRSISLRTLKLEPAP